MCGVREAENDNPLAAEIKAEKANAYFARVKKMEATIAELRAFDVEGVQGPERRNLRGKLVAKAAEQVLFFMIQREAMSLPYYEEIFADFEIPDEVRREMGRSRL